MTMPQPCRLAPRNSDVRKAWFVMACFLCAAAVGVAVVSPGRIHRIEMATEIDGTHQDDHKIFGFVPYSTQRADPNLHVTDDAFRALSAAGIRDLPEAHRRVANYYPVSRSIRPERTEYCVQFDLGKKAPKDVADFYARQLTKSTRTSSASLESLNGTCPDGKTHLSLTIFKGPGGPPAQLCFGLESAP